MSRDGAVAERDLVVVVEDDVEQSALLRRWIGRDYEVAVFDDAESCLAALPTLIPAVICTDLHLPGMNGIQLLSHLKTTHPHLPALFLTADSDVEKVVTAVKQGAFGYLLKPVDRTRLLTELRNATNSARLALRVAQLEREVSGGYPGIVGNAPAMKAMFLKMERLATCDITVLIQGESGSGKELVARAIHDQSGREKGPFVAINCAAIPGNLIESELFGHERGAFTGATDRRVGRFTEANGGTLFLDEIGELDPAVQAKLLRVLQERTFRPVGGARDLRSDFRLVAASHRDLHEDVRAGRFREDLLFRIAVFELGVPPLRERREDVPALAAFFIRKYAGVPASKAPVLLPDTVEALRNCEWPGNVRELENAIRHALVVCDGTAITPADLPPRIFANPRPRVRDQAAALLAAEPAAPGPVEPRPEPAPGPAEPAETVRLLPADGEVTTLEDLEKRAIEYALRATNGNLSEAGRRLGIGRTTLYRKIKQYGLE